MPNPNKRFVDAEVEADVIHLHSVGYKDPDIARLLGFSPPTIMRIRQKHGLGSNYHGDKDLSDEEAQRIDQECQVLDSFCDGRSYDEIAEEVNLSPLQVRQIVKRMPAWWPEHRNCMKTKRCILSGDDE